MYAKLIVLPQQHRHLLHMQHTGDPCGNGFQQHLRVGNAADALRKLDPAARYKIRVVYGGDSPKKKIRLVAGNSVELDSLIAKPWPIRPLEFDIPTNAIVNPILGHILPPVSCSPRLLHRTR